MKPARTGTDTKSSVLILLASDSPTSHHSCFCANTSKLDHLKISSYFIQTHLFLICGLNDGHMAGKMKGKMKIACFRQSSGKDKAEDIQLKWSALTI